MSSTPNAAKKKENAETTRQKRKNRPKTVIDTSKRYIDQEHNSSTKLSLNNKQQQQVFNFYLSSSYSLSPDSSEHFFCFLTKIPESQSNHPPTAVKLWKIHTKNKKKVIILSNADDDTPKAYKDDKR